MAGRSRIAAWFRLPLGTQLKIIGLFTVAGVVVLIIIGIIWTAIFGKPEHKDLEAWDACRQFVSRQLKAPATADFSSPDDSTIVDAGTVWTVSGYVDSQNSFGAQIRSRFRCVMTNVGDVRVHKPMSVLAVDPTVEHAYPLRAPTTKKERSFILSGTAFTKYYGIDTTVSIRRRAYMDDGVLCIDLNDPGTVVTSNRQGTGGPGKTDNDQASSLLVEGERSGS